MRCVTKARMPPLRGVRTAIPMGLLFRRTMKRLGRSALACVGVTAAGVTVVITHNVMHAPTARRSGGRVHLHASTAAQERRAPPTQRTMQCGGQGVTVVTRNCSFVTSWAILFSFLRTR